MITTKMNSNKYLGKRGYIVRKEILSDDELTKIRNDLTVKPNIPNDFGDNVESFKIYLENEKKIYLPKFYAFKKFKDPDTYKIPDGEDINIDFNGKLRELQENAINTYIKTYENNNVKGGGIISLGCGQGKTVVALNIIHRMKKKTLVVVHKEFLMNQWTERIQMFLPNAKVGIIQQDKYDVKGKDIVLSMLQTISMRNFPLIAFDCFGLVIIDEAHRVPSRVFSQALSKINSKYMLALTATPNRKDGLTKVLKWFVGPIVFSTTNKKNNNEYSVEVNRYKIMSNDKSYCEELFAYNGKVKMSSMLNNICNYQKRNDLILKIIKEILLEHQERQILILSDRKNQLNYLYNYAKNTELCSVGYYIGGMNQKALKESEQCRLILATFPMANEGLDIPNLNSLILASPKSDIIQSVGRVLRKKHDLFLPKIVDIIDDFSMFTNQGNKRNNLYKKRKYFVKNYLYNCDNNELVCTDVKKEDIEEENNINSDVNSITLKDLKTKNLFSKKRFN